MFLYEEMSCRFRDTEPLPNGFDQGPDLVGIRQMLQMVNNFDEVEEDKSEPLEKAQEVIQISKLNPNVPEFVPKASASSSPKNKESEYVSNEISGNINIDSPNVLTAVNKCNKEKDCNVVNIKKNGNVLLNNCNNVNGSNKLDSPVSMSSDIGNCNKNEDCKDINIDKRIDISKLKPYEITDMTKKLKSKIIDSSQKDARSKRERNVAIATLLKLHSSKPKASNIPLENIDEKPILYTPEYFEKSIPKAPSKEVQSICEINAEIAPQNTAHDHSFKTMDKNFCANTDSPKPASSISSKSNTPVPENPDIRQSIEKVNKWFEKPTTPERFLTKQKGPSIYLGPISFKKKNTSKSPLCDDSKRVTPVKEITLNKVTHYRPSKYAEDLSKKYTERNNNKPIEIKTTDNNIWARVEMQMKAKEERMKKEQLLKSPSSASARDDSSQDDNTDSGTTKS
ncbi:hypothetical protein evm_005352 [Chilo suppressalis]|nr:hypothetical protein evm_005352 [Chilo suppressalis]